MSKHHVVPRGELWAVKAEGKARASAVFETQAEAIAAAKKIAANQGGYVLIHRRDGTIRTERVERIAGTIKVDVASGESLTVVQRKIERADKRLKALAAKVATKKKARDKKTAKPKAAKGSSARGSSAKKPAAKKAAPRVASAKKATAKKAGPHKAAPRKAAPRKAAPRKAAAKRVPAKKPAAKKAAVKRPPAKKTAAKSGRASKKMIGGKGLKAIVASASRAMRKLTS